METGLLEFSGFGIVTITPKYIAAFVTVVHGTKFSATARGELEDHFPNMEDDEEVILPFGVVIEPGEKEVIAFQQLERSKLRSGFDVSKHPTVRKLINDAVGIVKAKYGIS